MRCMWCGYVMPCWLEGGVNICAHPPLDSDCFASRLWDWSLTQRRTPRGGLQGLEGTALPEASFAGMAVDPDGRPLSVAWPWLTASERALLAHDLPINRWCSRFAVAGEAARS